MVAQFLEIIGEEWGGEELMTLLGGSYHLGNGEQDWLVSHHGCKWIIPWIIPYPLTIHGMILQLVQKVVSGLRVSETLRHSMMLIYSYQFIVRMMDDDNSQFIYI